MQQDTKPKLLKVIQKEIIINQSKNLVDMESGCDKMFNEGKIEELDLMYKVFNKEPETLNYVIKKMSPYIQERGKKLVQDEALIKDPLKFT